MDVPTRAQVVPLQAQPVPLQALNMGKINELRARVRARRQQEAAGNPCGDSKDLRDSRPPVVLTPGTATVAGQPVPSAQRTKLLASSGTPTTTGHPVRQVTSSTVSRGIGERSSPTTDAAASSSTTTGGSTSATPARFELDVASFPESAAVEFLRLCKALDTRQGDDGQALATVFAHALKDRLPEHMPMVAWAYVQHMNRPKGRESDTAWVDQRVGQILSSVFGCTRLSAEKAETQHGVRFIQGLGLVGRASDEPASADFLSTLFDLLASPDLPAPERRAWIERGGQWHMRQALLSAIVAPLPERYLQGLLPKLLVPESHLLAAGMRQSKKNAVPTIVEEIGKATALALKAGTIDELHMRRLARVVLDHVLRHRFSVDEVAGVLRAEFAVAMHGGPHALTVLLDRVLVSGGIAAAESGQAAEPQQAGRVVAGLLLAARGTPHEADVRRIAKAAILACASRLLEEGETASLVRPGDKLAGRERALQAEAVVMSQACGFGIGVAAASLKPADFSRLTAEFWKADRKSSPTVAQIDLINGLYVGRDPIASLSAPVPGARSLTGNEQFRWTVLAFDVHGKVPGREFERIFNAITNPAICSCAPEQRSELLLRLMRDWVRSFDTTAVAKTTKHMLACIGALTTGAERDAKTSPRTGAKVVATTLPQQAQEPGVTGESASRKEARWQEDGRVAMARRHLSALYDWTHQRMLHHARDEYPIEEPTAEMQRAAALARYQRFLISQIAALPESDVPDLIQADIVRQLKQFYGQGGADSKASR